MFGASSHESVVCGEMRSSSQHITCLCDLTMDLLISCLVMSLEHSLEKDLKKKTTHTHPAAALHRFSTCFHFSFTFGCDI